MDFISDIVNLKEMKTEAFNLIASGCGTGKTTLITEHLFEDFPEYSPNEVIFVTSRSVTANQQCRGDGMIRFTGLEPKIIREWNRDIHIGEEAALVGMRVMTYPAFIACLSRGKPADHIGFTGVKMFVFDECHAIFTDTFMKDIGRVQDWISYVTTMGKQYVLGLTATPEVIYYYKHRLGFKVNPLNDEPLYRFKAKHLICTNEDSIPFLIATNKLPGRTLIMCDSIRRCMRLSERIPNSAVVVSPSNKQYFEKDMEYIFQTIASKDTIPNDYRGKPLKVLISTTTLREGYNLREASGIENIISFMPDPMNLTQVCGRARYNLKNIVVVDCFTPYWNKGSEAYQREKCLQFKRFMNNASNTEWFDSVSHLVEGDVSSVVKFRLTSDEQRFIEYINSRWLVPEGTINLDPYRIWREQDREEILKEALDCRLWGHGRKRPVVFSTVMRVLRESMGYTIVDDRFYPSKEDKQHRCKLITSFDEEKISYKKEILPYC